MTAQQKITSGFNLLAQQEQLKQQSQAKQQQAQQQIELKVLDNLMDTMLDIGNVQGANDVLSILKQKFPDIAGISDIKNVNVKGGKKVNTTELTGKDAVAKFGDRLTSDQISNLQGKPDEVFELDTDAQGNFVGVGLKGTSLGDIEKVKLVSGKVDKLITTDPFKRGKKKLAAAQNVRRLLAQARAGNQNALNLMKTQVPRLAGEVGNLAQAEQETAVGGVSLTRKLNDLVSKVTEGKLSEEGFNDLEGILDVFEGSASTDINKLVGQVSKSVAGLGIDEALIKSAFDPFLEQDLNQPQKVGKDLALSLMGDK